MGTFTRSVITLLAVTATAAAQPAPQDPPQQPAPPPAQPTMPQQPTMPPQPGQPTMTPAAYPGAAGAGMPTADATAQPPPADDNKPKEPKAGDFDAGGQARFPNGPDEAGKFASFNWVAVDAKAKYFLAKSVTANFVAPIAIKHPDTFTTSTGAMENPKMFGGAHMRLDAMLPALPRMPIFNYEMELGVSLDASYMHEGALLLSDKDFPLFVGNFQPGFAGALVTKLKMSSLLDFAFQPAWVYQSGTMDSHKAIQIPMSLIIKLADAFKLSYDLGIYTGDGYSFGGDSGGRISTGGALDIKISKIAIHAGAGVASLLTGGAYPTISDSIYVDVNVKYVK